MNERIPQTIEEWKKMAEAMRQKAHQWHAQYTATTKQRNQAVSLLREIDPGAADQLLTLYPDNPVTYVPVNIRDDRGDLKLRLNAAVAVAQALLAWAPPCKCGWVPLIHGTGDPDCDACAEVRERLLDAGEMKAEPL